MLQYKIVSRNSEVAAHIVTIWDEYADLSKGELLAEAVHQLIARKVNLASTDLRHLESPQSHFSGLSFANCDLRGANLQKSDLSDADFSGADLRGADLSETDLSRASFCGAMLDDANLSRVAAISTRFSGAQLNRTDLRSSALEGADFSGAVIDGILLDKANIASATWHGVDVSKADIRGARWRDVTLEKWPIHIFGIDYRIVLLPGYVVIGSAMMPIRALRELTSRRAIEHGGLRALRFHAKFGHIMEALFACKALDDYLLPENAPVKEALHVD
ncbi:hypothetical protein CGLAMM_05335 [Acetobacteraceae bacterium EV16G]|uniref:Pentapeptide repeat-containing protein n=1 Tax=Sorlinia euscelidii TaxID=3081148 RepID=A0ABU7TZM1_9PROT